MIAPGNTLESFRAAVEAGVDTIEFDVLWLPDAHLPLEQRAPLVVAHDWDDAERRTPLSLTEALDAFLEPPLDEVEIDLDIKLPGREEEIVDALRERGLIERAMVSTMELLLARPHPRAGAGAAARLDLSESDQGLDLEALGEGAAAGGAGRRCATACPAWRPRSCRSSASRRCGSTTRWSAPAWPASASSPGSS